MRQRCVDLVGLCATSGGAAERMATRPFDRWRLCEVRAEDYAFVLLSRFINALEAQGGAAAIVAGSDGGWALPIGALVLGLRQVGLSGFEQQECMALERELATWPRMGGFKERDNALR